MPCKALEMYCLSLPSAVSERPFGPSLQAFKVGGKIFALLNESEPSISFKASEISYEILREQGRARRAPYLPRGGWLNVQRFEDYDQAELNDLIAWSHQCIVKSLTRKQRQELGL